MRIVVSEHVVFDADLPHYGTSGGVHRQPGNVVTSPVAMWVEALDLVLERLKDHQGRFRIDQIQSLSGAAQVRREKPP